MDKIVIDGKEYTVEDVQNLLKDVNVTQKTNEKLKNSLKESEELAVKAKEAEELRAKVEALELEKLQTKLESRKSELSKYLSAKDKDKQKALYERLMNMDDDEYDDFKEGKTDEELKTKDELNSEKETLLSKEEELAQKKEKIIKEAIEKNEKEKEADKLIPKHGIDSDIESEEETDLIGGKYPQIDDLLDKYQLKTNKPFLNRIVKFKEQTENYLSAETARENI